MSLFRRFTVREFELEDIKSTMRDMCSDHLSRLSSIPSITRGGVAMQAQDDLSGVKGYICSKFGHRKADCPMYNPNYKKYHERRKEGCSKWCSLHETTSHSDDECRAKGKKHHTKSVKQLG